MTARAYTVGFETAEARLAIINGLQALEVEAHERGLHVTAHAINNAKNACGWEMAGNIKAAGMASRGERTK